VVQSVQFLEGKREMLRRLVFILFGLSMALSACQAAMQPMATTAPLPPSDETAAPPEMPEGAPMADCVPVSFNPTPEPTLAALLPPPQEGEWIKGPDSALVTIIEYSDFQ
jgi:hypothetical protein